MSSFGPSYGAYAGSPYAPVEVEYGCQAAPWGPGKKTPFGKPSPRKSLNALAILLSLLLPWTMFGIVDALLTFKPHYSYPEVSWLVVALGFAGVVASFISTKVVRGRSGVDPSYQPSWHLFVSISLLLAWTLAVILGCSNYSENLLQHYDIMNLNTYTNVRVDSVMGSQLMDAGRVQFAAGTRLDIDKSMGFVNGDRYCVAPITNAGNQTLGSYDFWAVGVNCCTGNSASFRCSGYDDHRGNSRNIGTSHGGLRLLREDQARAYFRFAVQQAEAEHHIQAQHPLFFHWVDDPVEVTEGPNGHFQRGTRRFIIEIAVYCGIHTLIVALTAVAFSKLRGF